MRLSRTVEIGVGLFVALGFGAFLVLAIQVSNLTGLGGGSGYHIGARFENVGGLKVRSAVTMGGVRVGRVTGIHYDQDSYEAVVDIRVDERFGKIPDDSSASILTAGLLGEQYIGIEPGGSLDYLGAGGEIQFTQSALVLEKIIGQFLFGRAADGQGQ
jgi:phospholipid/cholesterol/gamma-HCH transport system substrate-binding protein